MVSQSKIGVSTLTLLAPYYKYLNKSREKRPQHDIFAFVFLSNLLWHKQFIYTGPKCLTRDQYLHEGVKLSYLLFFPPTFFVSS